MTSKIIFIIIIIIIIIKFLKNLQKFCIQKDYYKSYNIIKTNNIFSTMKNILQFLINLYTNSFLAVHKLILNNINYDYINKLNSFIIKKIGNKHIYKLKIIYNYLPRIFFLIVLIVETLLCHKLDFLYKISFILLLPILLQYFIFFFKDNSINSILEFDEYIIIQNIKTNEIISAMDYFKLRSHNLIRNSYSDFLEYKFILANNYNENIDVETTLKHFMQIYFENIDIQNMIIHFEILDDYYSVRFNNIYYIIYIIILFYILHLILL